MANWGVCTTLKAPVEQVLAFVAHHLDLGADRIWLYFDDPDDPAIPVLERFDRIEITRCDSAYWSSYKAGRPERHQNRQGQNMRRCYKWSPLPWLCHIDVDEFIWPTLPVSDVLDQTPPDANMVRMAPWEALNDDTLADDIFTARHFRAALRTRPDNSVRKRIFRELEFLLPEGTLSHASGKCFYRAGVRGFQPRLHGAKDKNVGAVGAHLQTDLALLHFHAQDRQQWLDRLSFRLERGAYRENLGLTTYLQVCGKAAQSSFYDRVQVSTPEMLDQLRSIGAVIEADLVLRDKVAALLAKQ